MHERAFVLAPLAEIAPDLAVRGRRAADFLSGLDIRGISRLP
jgi:2-amino-4-hydroxy-6-hydroxymethyldihydropteridine diphosphokinase